MQVISQSTTPSGRWLARLMVMSRKCFEAFSFLEKPERSSYVTAFPLMLTTPACSAYSPIQTLAGMTVASSSSTLTGPVRPFLRESRILSLSSSDFFSWVIDFTSPMVFSSWAICALVVAIWASMACRSCWVFWYQKKLPITARIASRASRMSCCRPYSRFFDARTGSRLIRIIEAPPSPRKGRSWRLSLHRAPEREAHADGGGGSDLHHVVGVEPPVVDLDALEGVEDLHRHAHALLDDLEERGDLRRAAGEVQPGDMAVRRGGGIEVEAALDLARHLVGDALDDPLHFLRPHRVRVLRGVAAGVLELLRLVVGDVELLLDLLGELVAAHGDVAGEGGQPAGQHVDVHHRGACVDQHHGLVAGEVVVDLERVLYREGVDVDAHRVQARLGHHRGVVVDHVLLGGYQEHVHLPRAAVAVGRRQDLDVDVHVLHVEGDVLLRLPLDALLQLLLGHAGHRDLLDDHAVAGHADGHVAVLQLVLIEDLLDRLDDRAGVHQRSVHDRLRRKRGHPECLEDVAALGLLELDQLHGGGADVETECELALCHDCSFNWGARMLPTARPSTGGPCKAPRTLASTRPLPKKTSPTQRAAFPLPRLRKTLGTSRSVRPRAKRIFRFVSIRQFSPDSMRSIVDSDTPARRASSALPSDCASRNFCTLFTSSLRAAPPVLPWSDRPPPSMHRIQSGGQESGAK